MSILDELKWRGLIADCTDTAELTKRVSAPVTLYCGFDPTADSLHVGSLVPLLALRRFQLLGHHPIAVAGGATGSIGDPSGKTQERQLLTKDILLSNIARVKVQLAKLLDFETKQNPARLVDNATWTENISFLDFLRDIGKHFSVNQMAAKESVRARMEDRETGISFTEFSYMLLQAFDFYVLARDTNCDLQIGGSDQWGNITAGIDLCRKKLSKTVYGLTLPLILNSDGTKFGKTEAGAVWLDPNKTSEKDFFQYWMHTDDRDIERYLKFFTFLTETEIAGIVEKHSKAPERRAGQHELAKAVTTLVHGADVACREADAVKAYTGDVSGPELLNHFPTREFPKANLAGDGVSLVELLVHAGVAGSKSQARQLISGGGIEVNGERVSDINRKIATADIRFDKFIHLQKGKKTHVLIVPV
ncbi:MAG TPA: tyrosine--tRNA ligase [Candidatus Acidoferrales bacterium]|nr:tyrosine--tRNA ligase [Candidatus Acidoferrales bacterium]